MTDTDITRDQDPVVRAKRAAATAALDYVEDRAIIGLGSGSTAELFVEELSHFLKSRGWSVRAVCSSSMTEAKAREFHIPLIDIEQADRIDLCVDGADEIDPQLMLIKGGGGCLLREKVIADASDRMVVIADRSKVVDQLGRFPLPVEVDRFGFTISAKKIYDVLASVGIDHCDIHQRTRPDGSPFVTDGGHYILDCHAGGIPDPVALAAGLCSIPGVVEHGLFLSEADIAIVANETRIETFERD